MVGHLEHPIAFGYSRRVEIRPPRKGEEYFDDGKIQVAKVDHNDNSIVLERVRDPRIKLVLEEDWADYAIARPGYGDKYLNKHGVIETAKRYHKTLRILIRFEP